MTDPVYPASGDFKLKQKPASARQYDGSVATAHDILAWVLRNGGNGWLERGYQDQGPDILTVGGVQVTDNSWVVLTEGEGFKILSNQDFRDAYEPANQTVYRG
jgi:hypothetical protein